MLDLDATDKIAFYAVIWGTLLLIALARLSGGRRSTIGLPFAFLMSYTIVHAGALVHLVDGYNPAASPYLAAWNYTRETVALGLEASCLAMIAAMLGFAIVGRYLTSMEYDRGMQKLELEPLRQGSLLLFVIGLGVLLVNTAFNQIGFSIPGFQAVMTTLRNLLVVGACGLVLHKYFTLGEHRAMILAGFLALLVPAVLLVTTAILSDSIQLALIIMSFYFSLQTPRKSAFRRNLFIMTAVVALVFVFAVFYLQTRGVLRQVVWSGGDIESAIEAVGTSANNFNIETSLSTDSLTLLDSRLNQNIFVGLAIERLQAFPQTYENGRTVWLALLGWVPRVLWPDKPRRGGSGFVAKHTGLEFGRGITFGAGPIFEYYVNFGYVGVAVGFLILGGLLRMMDVFAYRALWVGDLGQLAQYMSAGIVLLAPLANLISLVTSFAAALIIGIGFRFVWKGHKKPPLPSDRDALQRP